jgi:hypothetical protein
MAAYAFFLKKRLNVAPEVDFAWRLRCQHSGERSRRGKRGNCKGTPQNNPPGEGRTSLRLAEYIMGLLPIIRRYVNFCRSAPFAATHPRRLVVPLIPDTRLV